jgi:hypothetical protein
MNYLGRICSVFVNRQTAFVPGSNEFFEIHILCASTIQLLKWLEAERERAHLLVASFL